MTAEVAVMNRSAVALAADSAMSVGNTGKTYPTNKLFALSKHHPVGVMMYNNAEFMGICTDTQKTANLLRVAEGLFERMSQEVRAGSAADPSLSQDNAISEIVERHATALRDAGEAPSMQDVPTRRQK